MIKKQPRAVTKKENKNFICIKYGGKDHDEKEF